MKMTFIVMFNGSPLWAFNTRKEAQEFIDKCVKLLQPSAKQEYKNKVKSMTVLSIPYFNG